MSFKGREHTMRLFRICGSLAIIMLAISICAGPVWAEENSGGEGLLTINGKIQDKTGNPISDARVALFQGGKPYDLHTGEVVGHGKQNVSGSNGLFSLEIHAPVEEIKKGDWAIKISKPSFKSTELIPLTKIADLGKDSHGIPQMTASLSIKLKRFQGIAFWIALLVLIGIYALISLELVHRTLAAFMGAAAVLVITHTFGHFDSAYEIITFEQSLHAVDWNVIFLLMGMMVIVGVLKESGVFQWMAYKAFQLTKGRIFLLAAALCVVTAVLSAFLDNVTTMLLLTPVTIEIALVLGISPFAFLLPEIMASNFGGTATLIGDPPNIMIGSYAGLTFNDFAIMLTPVVVITLVAQILYTKWYYGKDYDAAKVEDVPEMINFLREKYQITDMKILYVGGTVLLGVVVLFMLHGMFHMEVSVAALFGAALIVFLNKVSIVEILERDIEWPSLVFFIMLFIIVGAAEETGILQYVADWLMSICAGNITIAILLIMWTAAILSAIVDNIPFTATMLPVVAFLSNTIPGAETGVLWWALALGACFGGNATIIGASANVITVGIAEKAGHKITFIDFIKHGTPITFVGLLFASAYLLLVF
jgi:Na+/H+ antiporter NhaD/arsenite permease-like protein